jgi:2-furoyl-CoA dehydrogenase large subunit
MLLDAALLRRVLPGCHALNVVGPHSYHADISLGAGPVRGRFGAKVSLSALSPPESATLHGSLIGPLGAASGSGEIRLTEVPTGTRADYQYEVTVSGKVAAVGGRMLDGAARAIIALFFRQLIAETGQRPHRSWRNWMRRRSGHPAA